MLRNILKKASIVARDEEGITAVEYVVLAALVAAGLIATVPTLTAAFTQGFTAISTAISSASK